MLQNNLADYKIILASGSPRRQQFFKELQLDFEVRLKPVDEVYPKELQGSEISDYLAALKATPFQGGLLPQEILITSDTVVWHKDKSLAKASNATEAFQMLKTLSGDWHEVITSVTFTTHQGQKTVHHSTEVKLKELSDDEIWFYINTCQPFDKAGAYGIQEWIGLIAIEEIRGSYTNVVGLPTHLVYKTLIEMVN
ncbi:MAG: Maf-like protein [Maribacter sp.]|uniref:Maf-like protein n=1 Tax=Maribacter sp. TaxID=1897614 RepID=UPI003296EBE4